MQNTIKTRKVATVAVVHDFYRATQLC